MKSDAEVGELEGVMEEGSLKGKDAFVDLYLLCLDYL